MKANFVRQCLCSGARSMAIAQTPAQPLQLCVATSLPLAAAAVMPASLWNSSFMTMEHVKIVLF